MSLGVVSDGLDGQLGGANGGTQLFHADLTTAAVEEFVESHYQHQIHRLTTDPQHVGHAPSAELRRMLMHCCEDEVHHKEEGAKRAAEGPLPWFSQVDTIWQWLVGAGSAVAAMAAKKSWNMDTLKCQRSTANKH